MTDKLTNTPPDHKDKLGRSLAVGDTVCYPSFNTLELGTIKKLNPKMVTVQRVGPRKSKGQYKYPSDLIKIEGPEVTLYLLKMNSSG